MLLNSMCETLCVFIVLISITIAVFVVHGSRLGAAHQVGLHGLDLENFFIRISQSPPAPAHRGCRL